MKTESEKRLTQERFDELFPIKIFDQQTQRYLNLNPRIDDVFFDTLIRIKLRTQEYILVKGNLPEKWK